MRSQILDYLSSLKIRNFQVSEELPFLKDGEPLYQKNFRRFYVSRPEITQEPLYDTLNGTSIVTETETVTVYVSVDAKNQPSNYADMITQVQAAKTSPGYLGRQLRTVTITETMDSDSIIAEFTFSFQRLKLS